MPNLFNILQLAVLWRSSFCYFTYTTMIRRHHHSLPFQKIIHRGLYKPLQPRYRLSSVSLSAAQSSTSSSSSANSPKPSRSERKALERERKQRNRTPWVSSSSSSSPSVSHGNDDQVYIETNNANVTHRRNHSLKQRETIPSAKNKKNSNTDRNIHTTYPLHSKHISGLTIHSTANDVLIAIKRAQNLHDVHDIRNIQRFLLEQVDESFAFGYRGSILARLAVAALHLHQHAVARQALDIRKVYHADTILPMESSAIIRGLLRVHNVSDALLILEEELSLPSLTPLMMKGGDVNFFNSTHHREKLKYRALSLASFISRHFFEGEPYMAVQACNQLVDMGSYIQQSGLTASDIGMPWTRLIKGAAQCEARRRNGTIIPCESSHVRLPSNLGYAILRAMMVFPPDNIDEVYEALSNTLVRRSVFITGAVSMEGCPPPDRGEVVFIGRSNVGKSSLVNMVTNRKALAYTSKRPGKTQQFNFFAINDKPGKEKEVKFGDTVSGDKDSDSFYLVDVPGYGFAKVPDAQRKEWINFLSIYLSQRQSLRVIFHLIDSRIGPTDDDARIMDQIRGTKAKYVIVLTKTDKKSKGPTTPSTDNQNFVNSNAAAIQKTLNQLRITMNKQGVGNAPVLLTSSETKLGRDALWSYMRLAADEFITI